MSVVVRKDRRARERGNATQLAHLALSRSADDITSNDLSTNLQILDAPIKKGEDFDDLSKVRIRIGLLGDQAHDEQKQTRKVKLNDGTEIGLSTLLNYARNLKSDIQETKQHLNVASLRNGHKIISGCIHGSISGIMGESIDNDRDNISITAIKTNHTSESSFRILEAFDELIDSLLSADVDEVKNDYNDYFKRIQPVIGHTIKLVSVFNYFREVVINNKGYSSLSTQLPNTPESLRSNEVFNRVISILEYLKLLIPSSQDADSSQSSKDLLCSIFSIMMAVLEEGISLVEHFTQNRFKDDNTIDTISVHRHSVKKKGALALESPVEMKDRALNAAINLNKMSAVQTYEDDGSKNNASYDVGDNDNEGIKKMHERTFVGTDSVEKVLGIQSTKLDQKHKLSTQNKNISNTDDNDSVLLQDLLTWIKNVEILLSACVNSTERVSVVEIWGDETEIIHHLCSKSVASNDTTITAVMATVAREKLESTNLIEKNDQSIKTKEIKSFSSLASTLNDGTVVSPIFIMAERTILTSVFLASVPIIYNKLIFFERKISHASILSIFLALATISLYFFFGISFRIKSYFAQKKDLFQEYLFKSQFNPYLLLLHGSNSEKKSKNKSTFYLPRYEIKRTIISTLLEQAKRREKNRHQEGNNDVTVLTGLPGCGATTLALMTIKSKRIQNQFRDGIAWLSLSPYPLTFGGQIELYRQIMAQLCPDLSDLQYDMDFLDTYWCATANDDDEMDLMEDLRQEMADWFRYNKKKWKTRALIVLDGFVSPDDLKWFQFCGSCFSTSGSTSGSTSSISSNSVESKRSNQSAPSLLVLINTMKTAIELSQHPLLFDAKIIQVTPLNEEEVVSLLLNEACLDREDATAQTILSSLSPPSEHIDGDDYFYDSPVATVLFDQCGRLPLEIKLIGRMLRERNTLAAEGYAVPLGWWETLSYDLHDLIENSSSEAVEERQVSIVDLTFSPLCTNETVADILKLCFTSLIVVFFDPSYFLNEHPHYSPNSLLIPWDSVMLFWEKLLDSDEVNEFQTAALYRFLHHDKHDIEDERLSSSRSLFVRDQLEASGLIKVTKYKSSDGKGLSTGLSIPHESIKASAESLVMINSLTEGESFEDGFDRYERKWNTIFVNAYSSKLLKSGLNFHSWDNRRMCSINEDDISFLLQYLPQHMIVAGLSTLAAKVLADKSFVRNRMNYMGSVNGTKQHILDAESLVDLVHRESEKKKLIKAKKQMEVDDETTIDLVAAKTSVILAYERVTDNLLTESDETFPGQVGFLLFALGFSIQFQGWKNEAFMFHFEAINISRNEIMNDDSAHNVRQILSRALNAVGLIYLEKKELAEAGKCFSEAIEFSMTISGKMRRSTHFGSINHNLGKVQILRGEYETALDTFTKALHVRKSGSSGTDLDKAETLFEIGKTYWELGKLKEATKKVSEALHIRRSVLGKQHAEIARTLHVLGDVCRENGETEEAIQVYIEATDVWSEVYQEDDALGIEYANALHNLGVLYRQSGVLHAAMEAYQAALKLRRKYLGSYHVDVAQTCHNIGIVYCETGNHDAAMRAYAQALRVREELLGTTSVDFSNTLHNIGVVLRQKGDTDGARKAFMDALWMAKATEAMTPTPGVLRETCAMLFGGDVLKYSCMSSRIFTCAYLVVNHMLMNENGENSMSATDSPTNILEWVQPILPLLQACVDSEMMNLKHDEKLNNDEEHAIKMIDRKKSRVKFFACDFSSVPTAVDMTIGSNLHLEDNIHAIENILEQVEHLCFDQVDTLDDGDTEVTKMLLVLHALATPSDGSSLRDVCAKVMPSEGYSSWPTSRFIRAADVYKEEFEAIVALLESKKEGSKKRITVTSHFRRQLCVYLSSVVRFHLRRLFDTIPLSYTLPCASRPSPDFSPSRSRTHEIVWMVPSNESPSLEDTRLAEAPISFVFNLAIQRLHNYYEARSDLRKTLVITTAEVGQDVVNDSPQLNTSISITRFALSRASLRCLEEDSYDVPIPDDDVNDILYDISLAEIALSAVRAAKFILSLLRWPGLEGAINEVGGWTSIEEFSKIYVRQNLKHDCPIDGHFILLNDVSRLVSKLEADYEQMAEIGLASQRVFHRLLKRFQQVSKKKFKDHNESQIRQTLVDVSTSLVFPTLAEPSKNSDTNNVLAQ